MNVKRDMEFPMLPRFGIRLFLDKEFDNAEYYGIGPDESYVDKKRSGYHGKHCAEIHEMHEDYLRPQENGSHTDCDYLILKGTDLTFATAGEKTFSFNASPYTQEELTTKNTATSFSRVEVLFYVWIMHRTESVLTAVGRNCQSSIVWMQKNLTLRLK